MIIGGDATGRERREEALVLKVLGNGLYFASTACATASRDIPGVGAGRGGVVVEGLTVVVDSHLSNRAAVTITHDFHSHVGVAAVVQDAGDSDVATTLEVVVTSGCILLPQRAGRQNPVAGQASL